MQIKHLSTSLMAGVMASALILSPVMAQAESSWTGLVMPIGGLALTLATAGTVATMTGINTDAIQIAEEALLYAAMLRVTDDWQPEPRDTYSKAVQENDDGNCPAVGEAPVADPVPYATYSLVAKGIESVPLAANPDVLIPVSGRYQAMEKLTFLKGTDPNLSFNTDFTSTQEEEIVNTQRANEQWIATQGIARAELALMTAQQGAVDDGFTLSDTSSSLETEGQSDIQKKAEGAARQVSVAGLVGQGTSTAHTMRIQSVMNLELAQRMNLTNMIQGNILSAEAARLLQKSNPN